MLKAEKKFKNLVIEALERALYELVRTDNADEMWRILGRMSDTIVDAMD